MTCKYFLFLKRCFIFLIGIAGYICLTILNGTGDLHQRVPAHGRTIHAHKYSSSLFDTAWLDWKRKAIGDVRLVENDTAFLPTEFSKQQPNKTLTVAVKLDLKGNVIGNVSDQRSVENGSEPIPSLTSSRRLDNDVMLKNQSLETNNTEEEKPKGWMTRILWDPKDDHQVHRYWINPKNNCEISSDPKERSDNLTLLILVKSASGNSKRRATVRNTYMQGATKYNVSCRTYFILGVPTAGEESKEQADVRKEAETYGDIIQADFIDSYYNLTTKLIAAFNWTVTFCKQSRFVMSTDDDIMINIFSLVDDLSKAPTNSSEFVLGQVTSGVGPIRNPKSKWYTPKEMFPLEKYPTYPQGHGYIMSGDVVVRVNSASQELPPPVPWDDVYFGILLDKLKISLINRRPWFSKRHPVNDTEAESEYPVLHKDYLEINLSVDAMLKIWKAIESDCTDAPNSRHHGNHTSGNN